MSDFITFRPKVFHDRPTTCLTANKADVVSLEVYDDGSASLWIRDEHAARCVEPADVLRLQQELMGVEPVESHVDRVTRLHEVFGILTPDQTKP